MLARSMLVVLAFGATAARAELTSAMISYPLAPLRAGVEGAVRYTVALTRDGYVKGCTVVESSGNAVLDRETCKQLRETGRFTPGVDETGRHVVSSYTGVLRWSIPNKPQLR